MTISARIAALQEKHAQLDASINAEEARPLPDFTAIAELKKRKLAIKEQIEALEAERPKQANG